ncbi:hypothetical protein FRC11_014554 [Ceratobasidium sp. 423]|nr:hypothetical protein FRC11_014554 [Ceratobasidium sp. 423]
MDIIEAIVYLHEHPNGSVAHGDIQPANIFVLPNGRAKLTNFSCAFQYIVTHPSRHMSLSSMGAGPVLPSLYGSPEQHEGTGKDRIFLPTLASDIWSFGSVVLGAFSVAFRHKDPTIHAAQLIGGVVSYQLEDTLEVGSWAKGLIDSMLVFDPASRLTGTQIPQGIYDLSSPSRQKTEMEASAKRQKHDDPPIEAHGAEMNDLGNNQPILLINMSAAPKEFLDYIDAHKDAFIKRLADSIAIPSVSGDASYRKHVHEMGHFVQRELEAVGVATKLVPLGPQELDGQTVELPPVVFGKLGEDKNKKTVLIYAHYDVQPALLSDGWTHDPFVLTHDKETDRLYGRGSTDDKGPLLGWINVLEAHKVLGIELPVNLRVCFEGMEESGSEGLDDLIKAEAGPGKFFDGVDCVCISDNYWLNDVTPCLTYGLRGISYFKVTISGPAKDLHSGLFGNCVHEPMTDLFHLFSKLVTPQGKILIPGINELVDELTPEERERYERMDYSIADINESVGASIAISDDKAEVLMGKMRYPSLSIHGIEGAFSAAGAKTVIPAKISGKSTKWNPLNSTKLTVV